MRNLKYFMKDVIGWIKTIAGVIGLCLFAVTVALTVLGIIPVIVYGFSLIILALFSNWLTGGTIAEILEKVFDELEKKKGEKKEESSEKKEETKA